MAHRVFNFSAGPAMLPEPVLQKAADEMLDYNGSGMSVMELSHRSKLFGDIMTRAEQNLRDLMNIPDDYSVMFIQGGASYQFMMVPMNLLDDRKKADYVISGSWSKKAIAQGKLFGDMQIVADSSDSTFDHFPRYDAGMVREDASYLHITSNNTIYGTSLFDPPEVPVPVVTDASSFILSQEIDVSKYGLIYAGAQKNIGPAGVTIVIARKDLIRENNLPAMASYKTYADSGSLYNTPPTYSIYMANLVFEYLKSRGGIAEIEKVNREKARMVYDAVDQSNLFKAHVQDKASRSLMNIPFFADSDEINQKFVTEAEKEGLVTLKGHRSVGGMRASIYNAMPVEGCEKLVAFINEFDSNNS